MTAVADLDTPIVTVDLEIMRDNIRSVQDLSACVERPKVGDVVHVVPNHCCVVTNMVDEVHGVRNGTVEVVWPVSARGKMR